MKSTTLCAALLACAAATDTPAAVLYKSIGPTGHRGILRPRAREGPQRRVRSAFPIPPRAALRSSPRCPAREEQLRARPTPRCSAPTRSSTSPDERARRWRSRAVANEPDPMRMDLDAHEPRRPGSPRVLQEGCAPRPRAAPSTAEGEAQSRAPPDLHGVQRGGVPFSPPPVSNRESPHSMRLASSGSWVTITKAAFVAGG